MKSTKIAESKHNNHKVIIKKTSYASIKIYKLINHQLVCRYIDDINGKLIIEKYDGMELRKILDLATQYNFEISENFFKTIIWQVAYGLMYLQKNNIVHNDLHCSNILVKRGKHRQFKFNNKIYIMPHKANIKIIDFELSSLNNKNGRLTAKHKEYGMSNQTSNTYDIHLFLNDLISVYHELIKYSKLINFFNDVLPIKYRGQNSKYVKEFRLKIEYQNDTQLYTPKMILNHTYFM